MNSLQGFMWYLYSFAYDVLNKLDPYVRQMREVVSTLKLQGNETVLEVGAGTGNLTVEVLAGHPNAKITLLEPCRGMMRRARRKLGSRVMYVEGTTASLSNQGAFDRIVAVNVVYTLGYDGSAGLITELFGRLNSGGRLVISDPKHGSSWLKIMVDHVRGRGKLGCLVTLITLAGMIFLVPELIWVGLFNILIEGFQRRGAYCFRTEEEWRNDLVSFSEVEIRSTYAGQNWLITAKKED